MYGEVTNVSCDVFLKRRKTKPLNQVFFLNFQSELLRFNDLYITKWHKLNLKKYLKI